MGWIGYLLGPTLRAPYGANNKSEEADVDLVSYEMKKINRAD